MVIHKDLHLQEENVKNQEDKLYSNLILNKQKKTYNFIIINYGEV